MAETPRHEADDLRCDIRALRTMIDAILDYGGDRRLLVACSDVLRERRERLEALEARQRRRIQRRERQEHL